MRLPQVLGRRAFAKLISGHVLHASLQVGLGSFSYLRQ
jgi:hypothetical protein